MASSFPVGGAAQASVGRRNQFAQLRLDDLAHRVARERIEEAPFVGYLVARELFAAESDEFGLLHCTVDIGPRGLDAGDGQRSEEHKSELQSLLRTTYAVFCLKKKNDK